MDLEGKVMKLFQAAFSEVDITPDFQVELIGCERSDARSQGIQHRLCAQILLFQSDDDIFCLITIDSLGLTTQLANELRMVVAKELGTVVSHVMLNFSHTHSAPAPLPFALNGEKYFCLLCGQVLQGVADIKGSVKPCEIGWALTTTSIGENRREGCSIIDDRLGALEITDIKSGEPVAIILRMAAHANVLMRENNQISSDYFGVAREALKGYFKCPVVMIQGAAGNIKPIGVHKIYGGNVFDLKRIAGILEESVKKLSFTMQKVYDIRMLSREIEYISDVPSKAEADRIAAASGMDGTDWLAECERLRQEGTTEQRQTGEVQFLKINEGCFCGVPEELFCEISLDCAEKAQNPLLFLNGYTNGCTGYMPTAAEWEKGGFETLYSYLSFYSFHGHVMPFRADTAERVSKLAADIWGELKSDPMDSSGLLFGIYPLSAAGTPFGLAVGPEDDYKKIYASIQKLQGSSRKLFSRNYLIYTKAWEEKMLLNAEHYLESGLLEGLTIGCGDWTDQQEQEIEFNGWLNFIRKVIVRYGPHLTSLQITNEPNLSFMEGSKPYIMRALVEGVIVARKEAQKHNLKLKVGFGSVPEGPAAVPNFWETLAGNASEDFIASVDFVGHNFYVDVFDDRPLDLKEISISVERTLRNLREQSLVIAGIPSSIPIRITENGWPTGVNPVAGIERSYMRQAEVLEEIIRTIYRLRQDLNISHYELFGLRDADSSKEDLFHQYGIMRDDYTVKPAYSMFQKLIQELGVSL
jgi:hypothetical protein